MLTSCFHESCGTTTFVEFRRAIQNVSNNIAAYRDELATLMTERFQLFTSL
jgi:hypothetical protein